ncbi:EcsC family protein [Gluconobacter cerinus]|uniref:EcsC family protein n=1 Tax=Gluconobacter cerinus TaxID=38307 RepID=UPI001B8BE68B|nr:EcsC family protein [Gluconobacter cerinus]MBS0984511.1 EcsC family protein [Gluconobacter cerinus]
MTLSSYEKNALLEIDLWKNPKKTWYSSALKIVNKPVDIAGDAIMNTPLAGEVIKKSMIGILDIANDAAQWSVDSSAIFKEFRGDGHDVVKLNDISSLDLEKVDLTVGWLAAKYKGILFAEGAAAGAIGIPGLAIDVPALLLGCLRAVGEYATYYGFDVNNQKERIYALNVLSLASSPTDAAKAVAMAQLTKISGDIAKKATWKELEKSVFVKMVQEIAKQLGIRLTKAKLAQVVPAVGAVAGGGFNAYYVSKVCESAHHLYRERFIIEKSTQ